MPSPDNPWGRPNPNQNNQNMDELLDQLQQQFKQVFPKNQLSLIIIILVILGWLASSSFFIVNPQEEALVKRFGEVNRTVGPGLQFKFPSPIETYLKEKVTEVRRIEIGFRTIAIGPPAKIRPVKQESLMLTGDENIIDLQFTIQYRINQLDNYLLQITSPEELVKTAAESAMRGVIGHIKVDEAINEGKGPIELKTHELLQTILDQYKSGIYIENVKLQDVHPPDMVKEAFQDVTNAKEDREKMIHEAEGYANKILPQARGEAEQLLNNAQAYAKQIVLEAEGKSRRFEALNLEYQQAKEVTRERIQIETMEAILPKLNKVIADPELSKNLLPFLPIHSQLESSTTGTKKP